MIAAARAEHRAEIALPRHAHAQRAVDENLELDGYLSRFFDFLAAHLAREHHALEAHFIQRAHARGGVDAHLGGGVQRKLRGDLPRQPRNSVVLHDKRVGVSLGYCIYSFG